MRVLALDLSTHTGYALLDGEMGSKPELIASGTIDFDKQISDFGPYPHCYRKAAMNMASLIYGQTMRLRTFDENPDVIVVEEINSGRARYIQKWLEGIHTAVLTLFDEAGFSGQFVYINSDGAGGWRTNLGLKMSKDQKKINAKLSKAKRAAFDVGAKLDKKALGIRGKITKKHLAVAYVNQNYALTLKQKDNNEADAIALGTAFFNGATHCDGVQ